MSNRQIYCTNLVLLCLGVAEGCAKPSLPIGDDPTLCMALKWTSNFVHYSYIIIYIYIHIQLYIYIHIIFIIPTKTSNSNDLKWISHCHVWLLEGIPRCHPHPKVPRPSAAAFCIDWMCRRQAGCCRWGCLKRWGFVKALKTNKNLGKFSIIWIELLKILGMNRRFSWWLCN